MEKRESETIEFKKSTSELKEGVISLASMLNKNGWGILYFGVKNDGTIVGQQIRKDTTSDISKAKKPCRICIRGYLEYPSQEQHFPCLRFSCSVSTAKISR